MTIPAILNNLLDYDDLQRRTSDDPQQPLPTYIWVKKGKKEEAWAVCSLLGLIVDRDFRVQGYPIANTYIFAPQQPKVLPRKTYHYAVGVEARFHLRDLQIYFEEWEADDAT